MWAIIKRFPCSFGYAIQVVMINGFVWLDVWRMNQNMQWPDIPGEAIMIAFFYSLGLSVVMILGGQQWVTKFLSRKNLAPSWWDSRIVTCLAVLYLGYWFFSVVFNLRQRGN